MSSGRSRTIEESLLQRNHTTKALPAPHRHPRRSRRHRHRSGLYRCIGPLRDEQERRRAELATYEKLLKRLKKLIDAGTIKISFRKGRMIVELESAALFDSGKTALEEEGQRALAELVEAFSAVSHRDLIIAGHTDNVPIKTRVRPTTAASRSSSCRTSHRSRASTSI